MLNDLRRGQQIVVTWIDASESKGIDVSKENLPNMVVETRKQTTGVFINVRKGYSYHVWHLVIGIEKTDELWHINSIPICLIKNVQISNLKAPLSTVKPYIIAKNRKKVLKILDSGRKYLQ